MPQTSPQPETPELSALSCRVCRERKVRCNKVRPRCDRCIAADTECIYLERRRREKRKPEAQPQAQKHPSARIKDKTIANILRRLEVLERLQGVTAPPTSAEPESSEDDIYEPLPDDADTPGRPSALSNLVSEAREILITTGNDAHVLDNVENHLRRFRMKPTASPHNSSLGGKVVIGKVLAKRWINVFFNNRFPIAAMPGLLDREFFTMIPELLENKFAEHVKLDEVVMICYYNVLFQGMMLEEARWVERQRVEKWLYRRSLGLMERWQKEERGKREVRLMDFGAAWLMTWMALELLDNNLAWRIFCQTCSLAKELGLYTIDAYPQDTSPEETELRRAAFWQLLQMDCLFRQHYGRPFVIEPGTHTVNFPKRVMGKDLTNPQSMGTEEVVYVVSVRLAVAITEKFQKVGHTKGEGEGEGELESSAIDAVVAEWEVEERFNLAPSLMDKWLYADLLFNYYTTIILLHRGSISCGGVSPRSLEAARASVLLMRRIAEEYPKSSHWTMAFLSYYPFLSFFTLFYNILGNTTNSSPRTVEELSAARGDLDLMLWLGSALADWKKDRDELKAFEAVAKALNTVAQCVLSQVTTPQGSVAGVTMNFGGNINFDEFLASPMEYARLLESEIFQRDRDLHEDWWDMSEMAAGGGGREEG